jgi:hypothetical protein
MIVSVFNGRLVVGFENSHTTHENPRKSRREAGNLAPYSLPLITLNST